MAGLGGASLRRALIVLGATALAPCMGPGDAQPATPGAPITITMIASTIQQEAFGVLISNFERVYPNITVNATYAAPAAQYALSTTELAAGDAPDLIVSWPGCGMAISICVLAKKFGYLAPMVGVPWTRFTSRLAISESKVGKVLYVYSPSVSFVGLFSNDTLFKKLGLQFPRTFGQLLTVCRKATADGTVAILAYPSAIANLAIDMSLTTVYAHDPHWAAELKAGKVTFDGTQGWHQALQEIVEMNNAGCFQTGAAAASNTAQPEFAEGGGLMTPTLSSNLSAIETLQPAFTLSQRPIPNATDPSKVIGLINLGSGPAVNARSPAANQAAAQTFVNFIARPAQDALEAKIAGGLSQYAFKNGQLPSYMSSFAPLVASHAYALNPGQGWWNDGVVSALQSYGIGLLTGQTSVDDVLNAMDAAWQQGPS
jgi:raffinose/stachyose/melibiose transport system substrate-binding protein